MPNRRKRSRVRGSYDGFLVVHGREWPVQTRDISLKGALISAAVLPPLREECQLRIALGDAIGLEIEGIIVRVGTDDAAMDFTGMDEETYAHLSTMVRLRMQNADMLDREELAEPFE